MPRQESPKKQVTRLKIVEAAAQLFSRQGFNGTSTREIARLADVNEATLFRNFGTKQELFWAALDCRVNVVRARREFKAALANNEHPAVVIPMVIEFLVHIVLYQPDLVRLLYFSVLELEAGAEPVYRNRVGPLFEMISSYLERCIEAQTVRNVDLPIAVAALTTSIMAHHSLYRLLTGRALPFRSADEAVEAYSRFWSDALLSLETTVQVSSHGIR